MTWARQCCVSRAGKGFVGDLQRLLRENDNDGWSLDRTFKDFTIGRASTFMVFLSEASA